jgi:hypothetical protein
MVNARCISNTGLKLNENSNVAGYLFGNGGPQCGAAHFIFCQQGQK